MKDKKTYKELKYEYIREFERVLIEMNEFRINTDGFDKIKEFEVPLPPKYLIHKKLKTKTYIVRIISAIYSDDCSQTIPKPSCLYLRRGDVRKKIKKIESLFKCLSHFIPERLLNAIFYICLVKNDIVINKLLEDERKLIKMLEENEKLLEKQIKNHDFEEYFL
jgi:hypothetical protein